jgi:hypothetical protein
VQKERVAIEHKLHNEHMYARLMNALDRNNEEHIEKDKTNINKEIEKIHINAE